MEQQYNEYNSASEKVDIRMLNLFSGFHSLKHGWQDSTPYNRFFSLRENDYEHLCEILHKKCGLVYNYVDGFEHYIQFSRNWFDFKNPKAVDRIVDVTKSYKLPNVHRVEITEVRANELDVKTHVENEGDITMKDIIEVSQSKVSDEIVSNYEVESLKDGVLVLKATIGMWDHDIVC